jgi:hypothetical protein
MQKLATMFGLFLMASLIMLSASAASIGSINLFSNAMATEKHTDKNDKFQEYESYYSHDNQYSPDYNYYYEPMKQQQQQSSYDNNYGYDDNNKKISYNNSYEDMKTYSTYPTKDKKYVCQTGQFQGFFVESVEFCKLKIAQGPQGPQGIQGIQGPIGPNGTQGPPGIITINDSNTYIVSTVFPQVNASNDESVTAICDLGDSIINGGYETDTDPNNRFQIRSDVQFPFPPTNMWFVNIQNIGDNPLLLIVYATCFDNPPLRP